MGGCHEGLLRKERLKNTVMKKLLLLLFITVPSLCFSQADTSSLTAKGVYEDVKVGFTKLVSTLQGPAKHTYHIYVIQQLVEAYTYLACCAFMLLISCTLLAVGLKRAKFDEAYWNRYATISIFGILFSAATIITIICFFGGDYMSKLLNPEYYAIKEIIHTLRY